MIRSDFVPDLFTRRSADPRADRLGRSRPARMPWAYPHRPDRAAADTDATSGRADCRVSGLGPGLAGAAGCRTRLIARETHPGRDRSRSRPRRPRRAAPPRVLPPGPAPRAARRPPPRAPPSSHSGGSASGASAGEPVAAITPGAGKRKKSGRFPEHPELSRNESGTFCERPSVAFLPSAVRFAGSAAPGSKRSRHGPLIRDSGTDHPHARQRAALSATGVESSRQGKPGPKGRGGAPPAATSATRRIARYAQTRRITREEGMRRARRRGLAPR